MAEYIERGALKERLELRRRWLELDVHDEYSRGLFHGCETDMELIDEPPAADVVEVVHGEWRTAYTDKENKTTGVECSECGAFYNLPLFDFGLMYNYCPNCGARMDGDV